MCQIAFDSTTTSSACHPDDDAGQGGPDRRTGACSVVTAGV